MNGAGNTSGKLGRVAGFFLLIGALGVVALMLITLVAVFWRYVLNDPIFGIEDLSVMALVFVAGSSVAYGACHRAHVAVNVINFAGRGVTRFTDVLMRICCLAITVLASIALFTRACGIEKACITSNFSIEHRPFFYFLGLCFVFCAVIYGVQLVVGFRHFNGIDPNAVDD